MSFRSPRRFAPRDASRIASVAPSGLPRNDGENSKLNNIKRLISCLLVFILVFISVTSSVASEWNEHKSTHFIIYYHPDISNQYIREFTRRCERYYGVITDRLGFTRFDFWLWEDRAKIFIYNTRDEYLKETGRAWWSGASVHIKKKHISTFYFEEGFFDVILPHELTHIILREFIGRNTKAPLWFDEGVACANEKDSYVKYLLVAKGLVEKGIYLSVPQLEKITDGKNLIVPNVFYATSASLIIFLLEDYKKRYFMEFCKELRDRNGFYKSMDKVYGIKDAEDLNVKFLRFLKSRSYEDIVNKESFNVEW